MKNWKNLQQDKCPNCNCKLLFRLGGRSYKIKANKGFSKQKDDHENMYFCSRCDGFQISEEKLKSLKRQFSIKEREDFRNVRVLNDGGYLSL